MYMKCMNSATFSFCYRHFYKSIFLEEHSLDMKRDFKSFRFDQSSLYVKRCSAFSVAGCCNRDPKFYQFINVLNVIVSFFALLLLLFVIPHSISLRSISPFFMLHLFMPTIQSNRTINTDI